MQIQSVFDPSFRKYEQVVEGCDFTALLAALNSATSKPADAVIYVPSCPELEATEAFKALSDRYYGGMPIQIGYCNGYNTKLNCVEYHRDSEVNIAADDIILLVGSQQDIDTKDYTYDTAKIEAFLQPAGTATEFFATTLHYAPCACVKDGFRVAVVLPKSTNTQKPEFTPVSGEDKLLTARNKWLIAHEEAQTERVCGAHVGLVGDNIDVCGCVK